MNDSILSTKCLSWKIGVPLEVLEEFATNAVRYYHPFLQKQPGKKSRRIDNPAPSLRTIQRKIDKILLKPLTLPHYLHGGVIGRSPRTNVVPHLNQPWVIRLDIKNFFPSITDRQIYSVWRNLFNYIPPVAGLLTALTTYHRHLPQGAPTSTSLSNLVLRDVDANIFSAAYAGGCSFTRYIDDIGISGESPHELIPLVVQTLRRAGFRVSHKKTSLMPASSHHELTGLLANSASGPSVPRHKRDQLKAALHNLKASPQNSEFNDTATSIKGRISYISQTNPAAGSKLKTQLETILSKNKI